MFRDIVTMCMALMIIRFIWKWALGFPISIITGLLNIHDFFTTLINYSLLYYLSSSVVAVYTIGIAYTDQLRLTYEIVLYIATAIVLFFIASNDVLTREKKARETHDYEMYSVVQSQLWLPLLAIAIFTATIIFPHVFINNIILWFTKIVAKIYMIPYLGTVLYIIASLLVVVTVFSGIIMTVAFIGSLFQKKEKSEYISIESSTNEDTF